MPVNQASGRLQPTRLWVLLRVVLGMDPSWGSNGLMQSDCANQKVVEKTVVALGIAAEFILPAIGTNDLFSQKSRRARTPIGEFRKKRYELGFAWASFARTFLQAC